MFNKETIGKMKKGSFLVNNARGAICDPPAVVDALKSGQLRGTAQSHPSHPASFRSQMAYHPSWVAGSTARHDLLQAYPKAACSAVAAYSQPGVYLWYPRVWGGQPGQQGTLAACMQATAEMCGQSSRRLLTTHGARCHVMP